MKTKNILYIITIVIIILIIIFSFSFNKKGLKKDEGKIKIITTLFPFYDFAHQIGGDKVEVSLLLPPGIEPHSFEPRPSDIVKINEADIFVYTGKFMEPWAEDIIKGISNKNTRIVDASLGINILNSEYKDEEIQNNKETKVDEHEHQDSEMDPHIWLNFENDKIIIDNILAKLTEIDQENKDYYENNAINYKNKLEEIDNKYRTTLFDCKNRTIVYSGHYAFGYLASKYNLEYKSAYGLSPNTEATANDLINIIEKIKKDNIKYIFSEELLNTKITDMLKSEAGVSSLMLHPAHNIKKDDYKENITFVSIMERNLENLKKGLECN